MTLLKHFSTSAVRQGFVIEDVSHNYLPLYKSVSSSSLP